MPICIYKVRESKKKELTGVEIMENSAMDSGDLVVKIIHKKY